MIKKEEGDDNKTDTHIKELIGLVTNDLTPTNQSIPIRTIPNSIPPVIGYSTRKSNLLSILRTDLVINNNPSIHTGFVS